MIRFAKLFEIAGCQLLVHAHWMATDGRCSCGCGGPQMRPLVRITTELEGDPVLVLTTRILCFDKHQQRAVLDVLDRPLATRLLTMLQKQHHQLLTPEQAQQEMSEISQELLTLIDIR